MEPGMNIARDTVRSLASEQDRCNDAAFELSIKLEALSAC